MKRTLEPGEEGGEDAGADGDPLRQRPPVEALHWVSASVGPGAEILSVRRLTEGRWHANHVVSVRDANGDEQELVLRRWARPEWESEDPDFTPEREAEALAMLAEAPVPTPRVIAVDSDGAVCDVPAILTTRLPGRPPERSPQDMSSLLRDLAEVLPRIHSVDDRARKRIPAYERYYDDSDSLVPAWSQKPDLWRRAAKIAASSPPAGKRCFIHRDYHPGNTLWREGRLTGVVDWASASWGSPAVDTAHMRWNLAVAYGSPAAEKFLEIYRSISRDTEQDQHYWDVVTVLDVIPDLDRNDLPPHWKLERLDRYLESVVARRE